MYNEPYHPAPIRKSHRLSQPPRPQLRTIICAHAARSANSSVLCILYTVQNFERIRPQKGLPFNRGALKSVVQLFPGLGFPALVRLLLHGPDAGAAGPALCAVPRAAAPPLLLEVPHGEDEPDDQADYE